MLTASPTGRDSGNLEWGGQTFRRFFDKSVAKVDYVLGEFYWRVKAGEEVTTIDFARPGAMMSMEENAQERSWTINQWLTPSEILGAFPGVTVHRWYPGATPAPHHPSPFAASYRGLPLVGLIATVLLFIAFFGISATQFVGIYNVPVRMEGSTITGSFGPIVLKGAWQALTVTTDTPNVEQGWVDIDIAFVERKTQESYEAYSLNEHYYGSDSDGPWSEGSRFQTVKIASLPAGTYDLVVDTGGHAWNSNLNWNAATGRYESTGPTDVSVQVEVDRGAAFYSNLFVALLLILLPTLGIWLLHYMFEKARLGEMDGTPEMADWMLGYSAP
jgi:hypothetical protein